MFGDEMGPRRSQQISNSSQTNSPPQNKSNSPLQKSTTEIKNTSPLSTSLSSSQGSSTLEISPTAKKDYSPSPNNVLLYMKQQSKDVYNFTVEPGSPYKAPPASSLHTSQNNIHTPYPPPQNASMLTQSQYNLQNSHSSNPPQQLASSPPSLSNSQNLPLLSPSPIASPPQSLHNSQNLSSSSTLTNSVSWSQPTSQFAYPAGYSTGFSNSSHDSPTQKADIQSQYTHQQHTSPLQHSPFNSTSYHQSHSSYAPQSPTHHLDAEESMPLHPPPYPGHSIQQAYKTQPQQAVSQSQPSHTPPTVPYSQPQPHTQQYLPQSQQPFLPLQQPFTPSTPSMSTTSTTSLQLPQQTQPQLQIQQYPPQPLQVTTQPKPDAEIWTKITEVANKVGTCLATLKECEEANHKSAKNIKNTEKKLEKLEQGLKDTQNEWVQKLTQMETEIFALKKEVTISIVANKVKISFPFPDSDSRSSVETLISKSKTSAENKWIFAHLISVSLPSVT